MADTIVNTPRDRSDDSANAAGWVLAIVVIIAVLLAGFWWVRNASPAVPNTGDINVTIPGGSDTGGSGSGGSGGTDTGGTGGSGTTN